MTQDKHTPSGPSAAFLCRDCEEPILGLTAWTGALGDGPQCDACKAEDVRERERHDPDAERFVANHSVMARTNQDARWNGYNDLVTLLREVRNAEREACAKLPPQDSAHDMWLLTPLGSMSRTQIPVEQYEELRMLAVKLAHRAAVKRMGHGQPCSCPSASSAPCECRIAGGQQARSATLEEVATLAMTYSDGSFRENEKGDQAKQIHDAVLGLRTGSAVCTRPTDHREACPLHGYGECTGGVKP